MEKYYSNNRSVQILISLMKANGIRKVVASPGTTNIEFVGSIENDPFFEIYSSVDERSAAYIACGLAQESNEAVALSCTGATASRNYFPGLTEAYYRHLPILAITSTQPLSRIDSYSPQFIDRRVQPVDTVRESVQIGIIHDKEDEWNVNTQINKALLELKHHGGGPVHINLTTTYSTDFSIKVLPSTRVIRRYLPSDEFPKLPDEKIAIIVGTHIPWNESLTKAVETFCEKYDACVISDHTSNYHGKYKINAPLICSQDYYLAECLNCKVAIHIGYVSGAEVGLFADEVWRINPDGVIRDTYKKLKNVFEMEEEAFFWHYNNLTKGTTSLDYYSHWEKEVQEIRNKIEELPFSNAWIAQNTIQYLPEGSVLYLGVLNSLRTWEYFDIADTVTVYSNTGGFGIDGMISGLLGTALASPKKLCIGVLGDLGFFYDMNVLGNRHFSHNIRLIVVNNGRGTEFTNYNHQGAKFEEDADRYIAAAGHFGNKSRKLIKGYVEGLGFKYLCAENKEQYICSVKEFLSTETEGPIVFEVFTDSNNESNAVKMMRNLEQDSKGTAKQMVKSIIGEKNVSTIKKMMGKR